MPDGEEFCTCNPHLKGAEVFRLQKPKLDTRIGVNKEIHHPNIVNNKKKIDLFLHGHCVK